MVLTGIWIPLADGSRLAARVWLPADGGAVPVPAILEYLPYRLNDGTVASDHQQMTWFAQNGYAGVRVDIRGSGESDGVLHDEYTAIEHADCVEVIAWIAAQGWCDGSVGMMGYSWSGFNSLQVAALRPPALKAIATCYASDDRYADDVHYRGGLVLAMDMLHWSVCMHGWQARPPDPLVAGDRWRETWLARLEVEPWIARWLAHQRRDAYWRHGSVVDDPSAITCAVLAVAGWTDGYSDSALRLMGTLDVPRRAIIGPWGHNDPVHGNPGPAVGILSELVRWWDEHLKGIVPAQPDPMVIAYEQDAVTPAANLAVRPGRWIGEHAWPVPDQAWRELRLGGEARTIGSVQHVGLDGGAWCADGRSADLPLDQRYEDLCSLTYDAAVLHEPLAILGFATARLRVAADRPVAMVSVRLCEVAADGTSLLVTRGQLNLCHRNGHAAPEPLVPGEEVVVDVPLDAIAHRFTAGSRIRVSISPCYWPLAWPSPEPVTLTVGDVTLRLPERPDRAGDLPRQLDAPAEPEPLASESLSPGSGGGRVRHHDVAAGVHRLVFDWDCGGNVRHANGLEYEDTSVVTYAISDGDPLSARVDVRNTSRMARDAWQACITATGTMTCTASEFVTVSTLDVTESGEVVCSRTWTHRFPRDHV
jgi:predicted acyl esterase